MPISATLPLYRQTQQNRPSSTLQCFHLAVSTVCALSSAGAAAIAWFNPDMIKNKELMGRVSLPAAAGAFTVISITSIIDLLRRKDVESSESERAPLLSPDIQHSRHIGGLSPNKDKAAQSAAIERTDIPTQTETTQGNNSSTQTDSDIGFEKKIEELSRQISLLEANLKVSEEQTKAAVGIRITVEDANRLKDKSLSLKEKELCEAKEQIEAAQESSKTAQAKIRELEEQNGALNGQLISSTAEIKKTASCLSEVKSSSEKEIKELSTKLEHQEQVIASLSAIKKELEDLKESETKRFTEENNLMQLQLHEANSKIRDLEETIEKMRETAEENRSDFVTVIEQIKTSIQENLVNNFSNSIFDHKDLKVHAPLEYQDFPQIDGINAQIDEINAQIKAIIGFFHTQLGRSGGSYAGSQATDASSIAPTTPQRHA